MDSPRHTTSENYKRRIIHTGSVDGQQKDFVSRLKPGREYQECYWNQNPRKKCHYHRYVERQNPSSLISTRLYQTQQQDFKVNSARKKSCIANEILDLCVQRRDLKEKMRPIGVSLKRQKIIESLTKRSEKT